MISNVNTHGSGVSMAHAQNCVHGLGRTDGTVLVRSDSRPGIIYEVRRDHCPCEAFQFNHGRDASYRCKHIRQAFPAPAPVVFTCIECGQYPARQDGILCRRCQDARDYADPTYWGERVPVDEADVPVTETPIYRETLAAVTGSTDALHHAIAEGRARHEAAMRAPVGTSTLLAGCPYGDLFD